MVILISFKDVGRLVVSPSRHSASGALFPPSNGCVVIDSSSSRKHSAEINGGSNGKARRNVRKLLKGMSVDMAMPNRVGSNFRRISNTVGMTVYYEIVADRYSGAH